jgi:hypothetical protein
LLLEENVRGATEAVVGGYHDDQWIMVFARQHNFEHPIAWFQGFGFNYEIQNWKEVLRR